MASQVPDQAPLAAKLPGAVVTWYARPRKSLLIAYVVMACRPLFHVGADPANSATAPNTNSVEFVVVPVGPDE